MRCVIYARVSTEFDGQKTSIENQISMFENYASDRGWEIVKVYTDKKSATKGNRPGLKTLIEDGKAGMFDVILAKELSRLARNGLLSYELKNTCLHHNIHIICLDNSINTVTGNDQNFGLFAWVYENESYNNSRRNKEAIRAKASRGKFVGSNPPYGYYSEKGKLKIRGDETPNIVRRIYSEYLEGKGMDSIAKSLTSEKIPTPSQVAEKANASPLWHASTVKNILNNQHYCGDLVQNKTETISVTTTKRRSLDSDNMTIIEGQHDPIIAKETFDSVQKMLKSRTRTTTAPKKHLFTNMLFCENCQKGMWYKANQKGYRCGGNIKYGDSYCNNRIVIREKELKQLILNDFQELFSSFQDESFMSTIQNKLSKKKLSVEKELLKVEKKVKDLRMQKMKYTNLYTDDVITREELVEYRQFSDQEIAKLEGLKEQLLIKLDECSNENFTLDLATKLNGISLLKDLTPQVLHSLVDKITCNLDGDLRIKYNFVNPLQ